MSDRRATTAMELAEESDVCDCCAASADLRYGAGRRNIFFESPLRVALKSWCRFVSVEAGTNGINAGPSSSSSASEFASLLAVKRAGGRRRIRLSAGGSESESASEELASGDVDCSRSGERFSASAIGDGRPFAKGECDRLWSLACAGRGLVCVA